MHSLRDPVIRIVAWSALLKGAIPVRPDRLKTGWDPSVHGTVDDTTFLLRDGRAVTVGLPDRGRRSLPSHCLVS